MRIAHAMLAVVCSATLLSGCAKTVKPISIRNPVLSFESRRLLADTQDTMSIRRAERDDAKLALANAAQRREEMLGREWPANASGAVGKLRALEDGRVSYAELTLDHAQAALDLAEAKYAYTTAQTAMRHDLAIYELEPLEASVDSSRSRLEQLSKELETRRPELDKLETSWWQAYSAFVKGGGDSKVFYQAAERS